MFPTQEIQEERSDGSLVVSFLVCNCEAIRHILKSWIPHVVILGRKISEVVALLRELAHFYPIHIEKEDKHFFYPCMEYFRPEEQDKMLAEFYEFDRKMIHEKYGKVVNQIEAKSA